MKTLYLLRHAKSSRDDTSRDDTSWADRDRPLDARGERDAAKLGQRWSKRHGKPDLILSSPAVRALATANIVAEALGYKARNIEFDARLYAATAATLTSVIEALDGKLDRVMLVGHNPGFAELVHHFDSAITHMPTCSLAEFTFDARTWSGIGHARPARTTFDSPKQSSA